MATWSRTLVDLTLVGVGGALLIKLFVGLETGGTGRTDERKAEARAFEFRNIERGEQVELSGYDFSGHELTVVLAYREDCRFCRLSLDFHRRLSRALSSQELPLVVVTEDNKARLANALARDGIQASAVLSVSGLKPMVSATPSLLLIDGAGRLSAMWVGKVSPATEAYILSQVTRLTTE